MAQLSFNFSIPQDSPSDERRPIPGFDGRFEIDLQGNVYAMAAYQKLPAGRIMRVRVTPDGYSYVTLYWNGKTVIGFIHRLLMLTFHPVENSHLLEVNHIDLNKKNNRLDNLEWMTHAENMKHARKLKAWKNQPYGEQLIHSKLTADKVREVRRMRESGMLHREIAAQFNVSTVAITNVINGKSWGHIK
jgi:hypothetical protein